MSDLRDRLMTTLAFQIQKLKLEADHEQITDKLLEYGFSEMTAHLLEASDLEQAGLPKLAARLLANKIIPEFHQQAREASPVHEEFSNIDPLPFTQSSQSTSQESSTSNQRDARRVQEQHVRESLYPQFRLNWTRLYELREKSFFEKGRKIGPDLRKDLVRECVFQVKKKLPNSKRAVMEKVYEQLSHKYPGSFLRKLANGKTVVDSGFLKQLKDTFDNSNRPNRNHKFRRPSKVEYEKPPHKFAYGCTRWRVHREFLDEDTENMLSAKQKYMKMTFRDTRPQRWDWTEILNAMELTYERQRNMININIEKALDEERIQRARKRRLPLEDEEEEEDNPEGDQNKVELEDILTAWPFLFTYEGMKMHFQLLTEVDADDLKIFVEKEGEKMIEFFTILRAQKTAEDLYKKTLSRMKNELKKQGSDKNDTRFKAIIIMAAHYMGEDSNDFVSAHDDFNGIEHLQGHLHQYPGITAEGTDLFDGTMYHISADSRAICTSTSFVESVAITFMLYYVLNMNYSPPVCATLEYLQRNAFVITPPTGHKRPTEYMGKKLPTSIVHPKVNKLTKAITDSVDDSSDEDILQ